MDSQDIKYLKNYFKIVWWGLLLVTVIPYVVAVLITGETDMRLWSELVQVIFSSLVPFAVYMTLQYGLIKVDY